MLLKHFAYFVRLDLVAPELRELGALNGTTFFDDAFLLVAAALQAAGSEVTASTTFFATRAAVFTAVTTALATALTTAFTAVFTAVTAAFAIYLSPNVFDASRIPSVSTETVSTKRSDNTGLLFAVALNGRIWRVVSVATATFLNSSARSAFS